MIEATELLSTARARGLSITAESGRLIVRPKQLLTDDLRATLKAHKLELIRVLSTPPPADTESQIRGWLSSIGEDDPEIVSEVLGRCWNSPESLAYYVGRAVGMDDRITCARCSCLSSAGHCTVAEPGGVVDATRGFRPRLDLHRRCLGYRPHQCDPDQRTPSERWPGMAQRQGPRT